MKYKYRISSSGIRLFIISICCFLLTSCVTNFHEYPSEWSAIVNTEKNMCPDITGRYFSKNEKSHEFSLARYITNYNENLFKIGEVKIDEMRTHIEFNLISQNELKINIWADNKEIISEQLIKKNGDFSCGNNFLTLPEKGQPGRTKYRFTKSSDNSLVMREDHNQTYFGLMVPGVPVVVNRYRRWQRFKAIDD